jgi:hypothetical protein
VLEVSVDFCFDPTVCSFFCSWDGAAIVKNQEIRKRNGNLNLNLNLNLSLDIY